MALDTNFVIAPSLQSYFVSKDTGLPLTNGYIQFYIDGTNIPKPVYELSGTFPDYTYTVLPNPLALSSVGTPVDPTGNDIIIYYFPFDGTPSDPGNIQLYTIAVYDMNGVLQFTRNAWPNFAEGEVSVSDEIINFVPNGQFTLHNNIPASSANGFMAGKLSADNTNIAPGGWFFERGVASTSADFITFPEYASPIQDPTGNPRYAAQIVTGSSSDTVKDLCLRFPNVNTFSSSTLAYNLYFEAQANGSPISNAQVLIGYFYGTGGSPSPASKTPITTFSLTTSMSIFNTELTFPPQTGKSIGTNNDDYVEVCIRLPTTLAQSATFTNFAIILNKDILEAYPTETETDQITRSFDNAINPPNQLPSVLNANSIINYDLYLPMTWTLNGLQADHSNVGKIYGGVYASARVGELLCDGSQYLTQDFDTNGIPYQRLQEVLYAEGVTLGIQVPLYGTGSNFATANLLTSNTAVLRLSTNKAGSQTGATNGSPSSGFTFDINNVGLTTLVTSYSDAANQNIVFGNAAGSVSNAVDVNSGCTITQLVNNALSYQVFTVLCPAASTITTGHYFTYNTTTTNYYVWFNINGGGGDPTPPGRTGIQVAIPSTYTAQEVANIVRERMNGSQVSLITMVAAGTMTAGGNFTFAANSTTYYVWYQIGGSGSAPGASTTATAIKVSLTGSETAAQVVAATQIAINSQYFAVPDFRGMFLRGVRGNGMWDVDAATRWSNISGVFGNSVGTFEQDTFQSHTHNYNQASIIAGSQLPTGTDSILALTASPTTATGKAETQPLNAAVNWFIKM